MRFPWFKFDRGPLARKVVSPKMDRKALALRQEGLRHLMRLALDTAAGRSHPHHQELREQVGRVAHPEDLLSNFPVIAQDTYLRQQHRYLNPASPEPGFRRFHHPLAPSARTAILMEGFVETESVMCFPQGWDAEMAHLRPECLAGPVTMLRRMATCVFNRGAYFPSVRKPIIAFTGLPFGDAGVLTNADRDQLWKAFGVPVHEYFLGHRHEVLAHECAVRMGLHLHHSQTVLELIASPQTPHLPEIVVTSLANTLFPALRLGSGLSGLLVDGGQSPCPCGYTGPRLLDVRPLADMAPKTRTRVAMPTTHQLILA